MSLFDNSAILNNPAFRQVVTLRRRNPGSYNGTTGKWAPGTAQPDQTIACSVQPASLQDLERIKSLFEGGARITDAIRIYSAFDFRPGTLNAATPTDSDTIIFNGLEWAVVRVTSFAPHGHAKTYGVRIDGQNG